MLRKDYPPTKSSNEQVKVDLNYYEPIYPKGTILNFILENAPISIIQQAVKSFKLSHIAYQLKQPIINAYPLYRNRGLCFGIEVADDLRPYSVDWSFLQKANQDIDNCRRLMKLFGKYHPDYNNLAVKHDSLVMANNKLCEPITTFLQMYKERQRELGKSIRIVGHKEKIKLGSKVKL